jgi:ankyrin repeat protein
MVSLVLDHVKRECINLIVEDSEGLTPLIVASWYGYNDIVNVLLREGAIDRQNIAVSAACFCDHADVVETLITRGCDVNIHNDKYPSLLVLASANGNIEIVENVIKHGAVVNLCDSDGHSPLQFSCVCGHLEVVKYLIKCGADVNICDRIGDSPLFSASREGHLTIVRYLIKKKADANIGRSCLTPACIGGHLDVVKYLIGKVDINKVHALCDPALHAASWSGHLEIVEYLIEHGAVVNLCSSAGYTPLSCAVGKGQLEVVKCLVQHGAGVSQGLKIAIQLGHQHIVDYLSTYSN